jgi:O-antigen/teichoic acid export membrane protein
MGGHTQSLLGRASPLVMARLVSAGVTFVIPLVLARALTLEDYGAYKQIFLVSQTLYHVLPLGVAQSVYFFVPRADEKRPYLGQALVFLLGMGLLAFALVALTGPSLGQLFSSPAIAEHRWPLGLYVFGILASWPLEISLTSQGKTKLAAAAYLVGDFLRAAALVVPVLLGLGMGGLLWAIALFALARTVVAWAIALRAGQGPFFDRRRFMTQLLYALPFGAAMLLSFPQAAFHQYVVSAQVSPEIFALYAVGCFQLPLVDLLYTPTSEVLMVRLGELERERRVAEGALAFREAAAKLSLFFVPMAAFLFVCSAEFIEALFGARFLPAAPIFRVSLVAIVLAVLPMDGALRARNQTRHIFFSYLAKAVVTVPAVLLGVSRFGLLGGIGAWALAELVGKAMLLSRLPAALSTPERRVGLLELLPGKELLRASGAAAGAGLAVVLLRAAGEAAFGAMPAGLLWRALPLFLLGLAFAAAYLGFLWAFGVRFVATRSSLRGLKQAVSG